MMGGKLLLELVIIPLDPLSPQVPFVYTGESSVCISSVYVWVWVSSLQISTPLQ